MEMTDADQKAVKTRRSPVTVPLSSSSQLWPALTSSIQDDLCLKMTEKNTRRYGSLDRGNDRAPARTGRVVWAMMPWMILRLF